MDNKSLAYHRRVVIACSWWRSRDRVLTHCHLQVWLLWSFARNHPKNDVQRYKINDVSFKLNARNYPWSSPEFESSSKWRCLTILASKRKITFSAILVAWSAMRSILAKIEINSTPWEMIPIWFSISQGECIKKASSDLTEVTDHFLATKAMLTNFEQQAVTFYSPLVFVVHIGEAQPKTDT